MKALSSHDRKKCFAMVKLITCLFIIVGRYSTPEITTSSKSLWFTLLAFLSLLQWICYRLIVSDMAKLQNYLELAVTLRHARRAMNRANRNIARTTIEATVNYLVNDFTNESNGNEEQALTRLSSVVVGRYSSSKGVLLSMLLYIVMHFWGLYLYFWTLPSENYLIDLYMAFILLIGTFQFLDLILVVLMLCIGVPIYAILEIKNWCTQRWRSTRVLRELNSRRFNPREVLGDPECKICITRYEAEDQIITLPCNRMHHFHDICIKEWLSKSLTCPSCRMDISNLNKFELNRYGVV